MQDRRRAAVTVSRRIIGAGGDGLSARLVLFLLGKKEKGKKEKHRREEGDGSEGSA